MRAKLPLLTLTSLITLSAVFYFAHFSRAAKLLYVSDLITDSAHSTSVTSVGANHTITFKTVTAIPASGRIRIIPEAGYFTVTSGLDFTDLDLATGAALLGPYADRTLAAVAGVAADGVSVVEGTSGQFLITLNSSSGIPADTYVQIEIGMHATQGTSGDRQIANPLAVRSYKISIETQDSSGIALDDQTPWIAITNSIRVGPINTTDYDPPVLTNGLPSGSSIPAGIEQVELSLNSDEIATCRYSTASGTPYLSMTNTFTFTGDQFHTVTVSGLFDNATFLYYVRCIDFRGNANTSDYLLSFTIGPPLASPGPGPGRGAGLGGGTPGSGNNVVPGGVIGGAPYPTPLPNAQATIEGWAYPSSKVTILRDGAVEQEIIADAKGKFSALIVQLAQAVYTFGVRAEDSEGRKSITFNSTFSVIAGTKTLIANILIPPTIELANTLLSKSQPIEVSGESAPGSVVEVRVAPLISGGILAEETITREITAGQDGKWRVTIATDTLLLDAYEVRARASLPATGHSVYSNSILIGKEGSLSFCQRSDINGDGRVNFVDFSILLFNWGGQNTRSDINLDGKINLVDFSIMLTCWSG